MLNQSKGPAVWGPRAQIDRKIYKRQMQQTLSNYPNLTIRAGSVFDLLYDHTHAGINSLTGAPPHWASVAGVRLGKTICPIVSAAIADFVAPLYQTREKQ
ncbi:Mitochondrial Translation Optimization [Tulasnella sp. 418]|nr:Mitochondrial Translation Optimization [Tulasnella sp. 418]